MKIFKTIFKSTCASFNDCTNPVDKKGDYCYKCSKIQKEIQEHELFMRNKIKEDEKMKFIEHEQKIAKALYPMEVIPEDDRNGFNRIFCICECKFAFPKNSKWGKTIRLENICPNPGCLKYLKIDKICHYRKAYGHYGYVKDALGIGWYFLEEIPVEIKNGETK